MMQMHVTQALKAIVYMQMQVMIVMEMHYVMVLKYQ
jgi:hypothetical protein